LSLASTHEISVVATSTSPPVTDDGRLKVRDETLAMSGSDPRGYAITV